MSWLVWCPERGETEEDSRELRHHRADDAAGCYAEHYAGFNGDPFDEITLRLRNKETDRLLEVTVTVEIAPNFLAGDIRPVDGAK